MSASNDFVDGPPSPSRTPPLDGSGHDTEWRPDRSGGESSAGATNGSPRPEDTSVGEDFVRSAVRLFEELFRSADGLIEVYADRLRLSVRRTLVQVVLGATLGVCAAVWLGTAAWATVHGLCAALGTLWGGRAWLGDLTGGALGLLLAGGGIALGLRLSARRELAGLRAKYERIRSTSEEQDQGARAAGDDGGRTPGPGGSTGAPGAR